MKSLLAIISFIAMTTAFANTIATFNIDEVDAIKASDKAVSVEDLRDGFDSIKGVRVSNEFVSVSSDANVSIVLKSSASNKFLQPTLMGVKLGGGDGGGG